MFAELLDAALMQTRYTKARFDAIDATLASHGALLKKILTAVTLPPAVRAVLVFEGEGLARVEGESIKMKIPQNKQGALSVTLKNATGGPGRVDGVPTWTASADGVVELTPAADGLTCGVKTLPLSSPDEVKSTIITFNADGDMGDGVTNVVATFTATVYDPSGNTVLAEIVAGEFVDVTAPAGS